MRGVGGNYGLEWEREGSKTKERNILIYGIKIK